MAAPNVKPITEVVEKWSRRSGGASTDYENRVRSTTRSWEASTAAAEKNYQQGVTEAAGRGAFGKGVKRRGNEGWKQATLQKGPSRYVQGVQVGQGEYQSGVGPVLDLIARTDIPARGPRGAAGNYQRTQRIGEALSAFRKSRV